MPGYNIRANRNIAIWLNIIAEEGGDMEQSEQKLANRILKLSGDIFNAVSPDIPAEWLTLDLTLAQLRVLLVLKAQGPRRMSDIAAVLGVTLSTATGIVDNLVRKRLVVRKAAPKDRRLVICRLSRQGQELINRLWTSGRFQIGKLLEGLNLDQLEKAADVAQMLFDNLSRKAGGDTVG
jgi:DNA-binding MarR family transcriptional regulator